MVNEAPLIFLDLDGVLLPTSFARFQEQLAELSRGEVAAGDEFMEYFAPHCVANLQTLVQRTGAELVLSSNRRGELSLDQWRAMWATRHLAGYVRGLTSVLPTAPSGRGRELAAWLAGQPSARYVILDDMPPAEFAPEQRPHPVQCDERLGFTSGALKQALAVLAQ